MQVPPISSFSFPFRVHLGAGNRSFSPVFEFFRTRRPFRRCTRLNKYSASSHRCPAQNAAKLEPPQCDCRRGAAALDRIHRDLPALLWPAPTARASARRRLDDFSIGGSGLGSRDYEHCGSVCRLSLSTSDLYAHILSGAALGALGAHSKPAGPDDFHKNTISRGPEDEIAEQVRDSSAKALWPNPHRNFPNCGTLRSCSGIVSSRRSPLG